MESYLSICKKLIKSISDNSIDDFNLLIINPSLRINAFCQFHLNEYDLVSPLIAALANSNVNMLKVILQHPDFKLNESLPLYKRWLWAVHSGFDILKTFITLSKININEQDGDGSTILHTVASGGDINKTKWLLAQNNCEADIKDVNGITPLYWTALKGHLTIFKNLIKHHADLNARNYLNKWTILMIAINENHENILKELLKTKAIEINSKSDLGDTALMLAAEKGRLSMVKFLVKQHGININSQNNEGWTALTKAVFFGHLSVVKILLSQSGIKMNLVDNMRQTALHWAVLTENFFITQYLLQKTDINTNITNRPDFKTALQIAKLMSDNKLINLFYVRTIPDLKKDELEPDDAYKTPSNPILPMNSFIADPPFRE